MQGVGGWELVGGLVAGAAFFLFCHQPLPPGTGWDTVCLAPLTHLQASCSPQQVPLHESLQACAAAGVQLGEEGHGKAVPQGALQRGGGGSGAAVLGCCAARGCPRRAHHTTPAPRRKAGGCSDTSLPRIARAPAARRWGWPPRRTRARGTACAGCRRAGGRRRPAASPRPPPVRDRTDAGARCSQHKDREPGVGDHRMGGGPGLQTRSGQGQPTHLGLEVKGDDGLHRGACRDAR